ncbi:MAG: heme ABC transporter ATP-binding protein [Bacteroidota bacterium]
MIKVNNISIKKGKTLIVKEVSLQLKPGRITIVLGNNGAGKSTLLDSLAGTGEYHGGNILWEGVELSSFKLEELAKKRAVLSQSMNTPFSIDVRNLVEMGAYLSSATLPQAKIDEIVDAALVKVDLANFHRRSYHTLSGGEKKRVLFAKCLVQLQCTKVKGQDQYLFLDEPTASLDVEQQYKLLKLIKEVVAESKIGVLAVLHDINLAAQLADEIIIMKEGKLCATGSPWDVLQTETLRDLLSIHALVGPHPVLNCPFVTYLPEPAGTRVQPSSYSPTNINDMHNFQELRKQYNELKLTEPSLRNRDMALRLGISEAELLSLFVGEGVTLLDGKVDEGQQGFKDLLVDMKEMGYVMALTRNEHCVHERKGVYDNIEFYKGGHNMGVAVNPDIDLRFFMNEWHYGMAAIVPGRNNTQLHSFQFFNKKGEAVHKIYSTPKSNLDAYPALVEKYKASSQSPLTGVDISPYPAKELLADEDIDQAEFREDWKNLKDTHQFFGMLRKYKLQRTQSFRLAPEGFTQRINNEAVVKTLELAAERKVPIMCFLHSKGTVQIHSGEVKHLKFFGDWYNVLDPKFNLHLKMPAIQETWIVKKPTEDGIVTSLELFDKEGNQVVYFFGARKPGIPELDEWKKIIEEVANNCQLESDIELNKV